MKNLKAVILLLCLWGIVNITSAQQVYNPKTDAKKEVEKAVIQAKKEGKHVLLQIGGNWCPWCIKMHKFFESNKEINQLLKKNYIFVLVNYSKENKNQPLLKQLDYPQRFGFPVLVVLNAKGKRLHTQNSWYLEQEKGYHIKKVKNFLTNWSSEALNPKNYK